MSQPLDSNRHPDFPPLVIPDATPDEPLRWPRFGRM